MVFFPIQLVLTQDVKEVPHNGSPQGREGLSANSDDLALVLGAIIENHPE